MDTVKRPRPPQGVFQLPALPRPHYVAINELRQALVATQREVVILAVESLVERWKTDPDWLRAHLRAYLSTAPSELPPLL